MSLYVSAFSGRALEPCIRTVLDGLREQLEYYLFSSNGNTLGGSPISKENFVEDFTKNTTIGGISGAAGGTASSIIKKINLGKIAEEVGGDVVSQFTGEIVNVEKKEKTKDYYVPEKINIPKENAGEVTVKKEKVEGGIKIIIE